MAKSKDSMPKGSKFIKGSNKAKTNDKDSSPKGAKFIGGKGKKMGKGC